MEYQVVLVGRILRTDQELFSIANSVHKEQIAFPNEYTPCEYFKYDLKMLYADVIPLYPFKNACISWQEYEINILSKFRSLHYDFCDISITLKH